MSQFGNWGRAGNQFFQYAFLTGYAKKYNLQLQLPQWVGSYLFGCIEPKVTRSLTLWRENSDGLQHPDPPKGDEIVNRDFRGYAQYHTSYYARNKKRIRSLFVPVPTIKKRLKTPLRTFKGNSGTLIGIHLRRGDYGQSIFPIIPTSWYLKWLEKNWQRFGNSTLFVATEDASLVADFCEYNPQTFETLGGTFSDEPLPNCTYLRRDLVTCNKRAMDWYPDFYLLSQCDVILGGSTTFSFFAAMLNPSLKEYWRATLTDAKFIRTDPWDSYPMLREQVRDYEHLDGISLEANPYW